MHRLGVPRLFEFGLCCSACELSVSLVSPDVCVYRLCHSGCVGCITGSSRPDSARGVHQAVTPRDREESRVAVRRPFQHAAAIQLPKKGSTQER